MPAVAITTIWWSIGLPMMLFLAALQQIPRELYEAAALDNASRWRTLWSITLPSIRRTIVLVIMIEVVLQFQLFGQALPHDAGRPEQRDRGRSCCSSMKPASALATRLRRRGLAGAVRHDAHRCHGAVLDRSRRREARMSAPAT